MIMPAKPEEMVPLTVRLPRSVKERLEKELAQGSDKVPLGAYQSFFVRLLKAYWGDDDAA